MLIAFTVFAVAIVVEAYLTNLSGRPVYRLDEAETSLGLLVGSLVVAILAARLTSIPSAFSYSHGLIVEVPH